jgi:hypothetical protein
MKLYWRPAMQVMYKVVLVLYDLDSDLFYFLRSGNSSVFFVLCRSLPIDNEGILICLLYFVTVLFSVPHKKSTLKIRGKKSKNDSQKGDF